jgi:predicted RNA-binding protein with PUA-like domain
MNYWLMKSEPDEFSVDDLVRAPKQSTPWFGVRNYMARNYMRDSMRVGDGVLFYHSSCEVPGIYGLAEVSSTPYPDDSQFQKKSPYYDPKAKKEEPRWMLVDVKLARKTRVMPLSEMREYPELEDMVTLRKGNRLSITPVTPAEWKFIAAKLK